jgi:adenylosuccinate lyase
MSREDAYAAVQAAAMKVWAGDGDFLSLLKINQNVKERLGAEALEVFFDVAYHTRQVDTIFARVFGGD